MPANISDGKDDRSEGAADGDVTKPSPKKQSVVIKPPLNSKQRPMTGQLKIKKFKMMGDSS